MNRHEADQLDNHIEGMWTEADYHEPMDHWAGGKHWQTCQEDGQVWPCRWAAKHPNEM